MITGYVFENGKLVEADEQEANTAPVLICTEPDQIEKKFIQTDFHLGIHTLQSVLDENELPRVESRDNKIVVICKHPMHIGLIDREIESRVMSLGAVIYEDRLLFIFNEDISFKEFLYAPMRVEDIRDVLINVLHRTTLHFHEHLRCMSLAMEQLEEEVIETASSDQLMRLFSLGKSMTYYVSALNGNNALIERIYNNTQKLGFNELQKETLDDIRLDSAQCCQEAQITTSIMTKMTDARISLMGNNVSNLMKRLTIISIIMMPMNLIAGIGGMSEFTVFNEEYFKMPMAVSYPLLFLFLGIVGYLTYKCLQKMDLI